MAGPIQHHFLPERSYLKHFEIPGNLNFIFQYQRNKEPVVLNIEKAAKERHLYTFTDEKGNKSTHIESALAQIEDQAAPVIQRLADSPGRLEIDLSEKYCLAAFIAFQAVRTPAYRDGISRMSEEMMTKTMQMSLSGKTVFDQIVDQTKESHPGLPAGGEEKVRQAFREGKITIKMNEEIAMAMALGTAEVIIPALMMKEMAILKAPMGSWFVTCDHPVSLVRRRDVPASFGGFVFSDAALPLGRSCTLYMSNPEVIPDPKEAPTAIEYSEVTAERVHEINKSVIRSAERFLFASENNPALKKLFDATVPPKRFTVQ